jgi:1-acyl-sn-glycerol-3-phosphate acyltransferase
MVALRSLVFNVVFYFNVIVLMILGLPMLLRGPRGAMFMARAWAVTSLWWLRVICGLRVEFRGEENIPQGGYILASKHQSFLETFALVTRTPDFAIILKRSLMRIPLFGLYLSVCGNIGIDRAKGRNAMQQIVDQAIPILKAGRQVYIYPEGTRRRPGAPPQYKQGVSLLYEATGAPCLPVALNTGAFWGRDSFLKRPGVAVIEFLPVIPGGLARETFFERLQGSIEAASGQLLAEARLTGAGWAA